jgi:hypothetical protein
MSTDIFFFLFFFFLLYLQGRRISQGCYLLHGGFLLDLFFYPEDGGNIFLRNFG